MYSYHRLTELAQQSRTLARNSKSRETKRVLKGMAEDFELMAEGRGVEPAALMPKYRGIFP